MRRVAFIAALGLLALMAPFMPGAIAFADDAVVLDRVVAVVNEEPVTWLELYDAMRMEMGPRLKGMTETERASALRKSEREYLETLVIMRLQLQQARKKNLLASDEEIDDAVREIRQKYSLDEPAFRAAIKDEGLSWDAYRQKLGDQISIRRLVDREVRAKLPKPPKPPASNNGPVPEGIKKPSPKRFMVRLIYLKRAESEETRSALDMIYRELSAGREFESIEAEVTGIRKGGTVTIEEEDASPELLAALAGLSPGEVSGPVRSGGGVSVIKLNAVADEEGLKMDALFDERYRQWLKGLLEGAFVDVRL